MRIFGSCQEAVKEVERDLFEMGIRVHPQTMQDKNVAGDPAYSTLELSPYGFQLASGCQIDKESFINYIYRDFSRERDAVFTWAIEEFKERVAWYQVLKAHAEGRVSPDIVNLNPGKAWMIRGELWQEFLHDGKFAYTYAERFAAQMDLMIKELRLRPETRQAMLQMYCYNLDQTKMGGGGRVPCSLNYQFLIRKDELHLVYTMRSNDFLTFFATDNYLAISLQEFIAEELGVSMGGYTFFTGSLHAYQKDLAKRGIF